MKKKTIRRKRRRSTEVKIQREAVSSKVPQQHARSPQKTEAFTVKGRQTASSVSSEEYQLYFVDVVRAACKVTEGNVKSNSTLNAPTKQDHYGTAQRGRRAEASPPAAPAGRERRPFLQMKVST